MPLWIRSPVAAEVLAGSEMETRSSLAITYSVWKALFMREALVRLFSKRMGTVWMLAEPAVSILILMFIFSVMRVRQLGGIETAIWIMMGMSGFFMFRRTAMIAMKAVHMNRPLFTYRQVKPVDAVIVRGMVEGVIMALVILVMLVGGGLVGLDVVPGDPLLALGQLFVLWSLGMAFGLVTSVITELIPELGEIINLAMMPLYFVSGVIFPVNVVPPPYRDWMLLNPLVHAIEGVRLGFAPHYHPVNDLDLWYPAAVALFFIVIGLAMHRRFAARLLAL